VLVTSGQRVQRNQPLIQLTSESLNAKHLSLTNSLIEKTKLLGAYKAQLNETSAELSNAALISLNTKIVQLGLEIEGLQQQLELQKILLDRSLIRSSIDGSVATFQPGEVLASRPVGRGDLLLEVMNEEADWQLELLLPEKRLGHLVDQIANSQESLKVKFVQATASENEYDAEVDSVATRLEVSESGVAGISIYASIDSSQNIRKTIGAEVIAKIDCGKRSLGYVWFGDILDWMRQTSWRLN
jgi:multidrug efflux pump subunit AcrA (membrane-fusion protein)